MTKEIIFKCRKCYHLLYCDFKKVKLRNIEDCPNCGEEFEDNWIFVGFGSFEKDYPELIKNDK